MVLLLRIQRDQKIHNAKGKMWKNHGSSKDNILLLKLYNNLKCWLNENSFGKTDTSINGKCEYINNH
jgi:hypothetical protein